MLAKQRDADDPSAEAWHPVAVGVIHNLNMGPGMAVPRVRLEFDGRISRKALHRLIDILWQDWKDRRAVLPRRPLTDKAIRLVRLVCLILPPERSWRERMTAWNEAYPHEAFNNAWDFQQKFRRAEKQLTDAEYGLEWAYEAEPLPPWGLPPEEEARLLARGGPRALRYVSMHFDYVRERYDLDLRWNPDKAARGWASDVIELVTSGPEPRFAALTVEGAEGLRQSIAEQESRGRAVQEDQP
ncbi:MAG: hypothetical protein LLG45_01555 [Actinomycetia bacterium]|nr:hypothetical protein [Actinomycetes bacterium]